MISVILGGNGKALISSDAPSSEGSSGAPNIGYPSTSVEIEHFMNMLQQTAPRLPTERLAELKKALRERR
jgi:hypothetical protein